MMFFSGGCVVSCLVTVHMIVDGEDICDLADYGDGDGCVGARDDGPG